MRFSSSQIKRYARHILLPEIGGTGQERICAASVAIPEALGAGEVAILYLVAAGIGELVIEDHGAVTRVDGFLYEADDLGKPAVTAVRSRARDLNPDVRIVASGSASFRLALGDESNDPIRSLEVGARNAARLIREICA